MAEGGSTRSRQSEKESARMSREDMFNMSNDDPMVLLESVSGDAPEFEDGDMNVIRLLQTQKPFRLPDNGNPRAINPSRDASTAQEMNDKKRELHFHTNLALSGDWQKFQTETALKNPSEPVPITSQELTSEFIAQRNARDTMQWIETGSGLDSPSPTADANALATTKRALERDPYIAQPIKMSRSAKRVYDDIDAIIGSRNSPSLKSFFTARQSADVFFRVESLVMAGAVDTRTQTESIWLLRDISEHRITAPSDLVTMEDDRTTGGRRKVLKEGTILPSKPEYAEDEQIAVAQIEFDALVNELQGMKAAGVSEDKIFKKILDQVNTFPYRKTANSFLKALAGRNREHFRPKRNFFVELARANDLPGLNCEGRAKMFSALLEAIGYDPENEIFLNWPDDHVQTLLKRKDGTWLAFEGSNRRPFIQKFRESTAGVCSLQEWKYTLYGLPTKDVIESVNPIIEPEAEPQDEKSKDDEAGDRPAWEESKIAIAADEAIETLKEMASLSLSGIVAAFAGSANEAERVATAYPVFKNVTGQHTEKSELQKTAQDAMNTYGGHAESLEKILAPRIAAAKRAFGTVMRPAAMSAIAAGCYYSYGAIQETPGNEPPSNEEIKAERILWEDVTQAVMRDMEVNLIPPSDNSELKTALHEERKWAPYTYDGIDFAVQNAEAAIEREDVQGEVVHTVRLSDDVRTIAPGVFEGMIKQDIRQWSAGRSATTSTWVIEGKNLDIHAAERALADIRHSDTLLVPQDNMRKTSVANGLNITWRFEGDDADEITLSVTASDTGERRVLGDKWSYTLDEDGGKSALEGIAKMEGRILKKQYGSSEWQAPVIAIQRKSR